MYQVLRVVQQNEYGIMEGVHTLRVEYIVVAGVDRKKDGKNS